jgi:hypothetical protein
MTLITSQIPHMLCSNIGKKEKKARSKRLVYISRRVASRHSSENIEKKVKEFGPLVMTTEVCMTVEIHSRF